MAKKQELAVVLASLETDHETLIEKLEEEKTQVPPLNMVACTLDTKYLDVFDNLCNDKAFKKEDRIA
eukprot:932430-Lingulodinium_polyedra.AAC.1